MHMELRNQENLSPWFLSSYEFVSACANGGKGGNAWLRLETICTERLTGNTNNWERNKSTEDL